MSPALVLAESQVGMEDQRIDHDKLFKNLIARFFYPFMELFLPKLASQMDRDYVKFIDKEVKDGKSMIGDLLVEVKLESEPDPILIHIECQASKEPNYSRKMLDYNTHFYTKYNQKVVSVVIYSYSNLTEQPSNYALTVAGDTLLNCNFTVVHLSREPWRKYIVIPNPIAAGFLATMRYDPEERIVVRLEFFRMLNQLNLTHEECVTLIHFHESYLVLSQEENRLFLQKVIFEKEVKVMEMMISFQREGYVLGEKQGLKVGEKKGIEIGKKETAKKMFAEGFSTEIISQITGLSLDQLHNLN